MFAGTRMLAQRWLSMPAGTLIAFLFISFVLYGNSLFGEFVYDDAFFTVSGAMRQSSYLWNVWSEPSLMNFSNYPHYRPLSFFTFSLNYLLFGESPFSFHIFSIALNGLTCWLVFLVVLKIFRNQQLAWCIAIFFAILPIHTEAVAYMKARDEILVAFFGMLAWLAFLRALDKERGSYAFWSLVAAAFSFCAFLSKESAVVLPGVFAGVLFLLRGWRPLFASWQLVLLQALALASFFALHRLAAGSQIIPHGEVLYFGQNPLGYMTAQFVPWTGLELFWIAVVKSYVPINLSATYGFETIPLIDTIFGSWMALAGLCIGVLLCALIIWPRTRSTPLGVGAYIFFVLYFPFSKIPFSKSIDFFAERWLYGPSIGLSFIAGYLAWFLWKNYRGIAPIVFTAVIVAYVFVLIPRNLVWHDETRLGESMVNDAPNSVIGYTFLANDRVKFGRLDEAADLVTTALSITRMHIPVHHVAAVVALSMGRLDVADQAVTQAEGLGSELANHLLRSTLLAKQGKFQESLDFLRSSQWYDESDYRIRLLLAMNLWRLGRQEEAEEFFNWDVYLPVYKMTREEKIRMIEAY